MSLARFYLPELTASGIYRLSQADAKHALGVLRISPGDPVQLFNGLGLVAQGRLLAGNRALAEVEVDQCRNTQSDEIWPPLVLVVSLPKGDRQKNLVEQLVQLGTTELVPLICSRSVAQPTDSAIERLQRTVIESCKQCGRNTLMRIAPPVDIRQLTLPDSGTNPHSLLGTNWQEAAKWLAHPYAATANVARALVANQSEQHVKPKQSLFAAVGPEGGFTEMECQQLIDGGWTAVSLGPRLLRIETAACMIAALWAAHTAP
jgi:16S rRNA (uracil1498-N3)-methyltransferase